MEIEFTELTIVVGNDRFKFQECDYLYLHGKEGYPLKPDMDFDNFFFVTKIKDSNRIELTGLTTGKIKEFNIPELTGNWWFIRTPENIRRNLEKLGK